MEYISKASYATNANEHKHIIQTNKTLHQFPMAKLREFKNDSSLQSRKATDHTLLYHHSTQNSLNVPLLLAILRPLQAPLQGTHPMRHVKTTWMALRRME
jgi:hypothetical protein